jgi:hypothetical protein
MDLVFFNANTSLGIREQCAHISMIRKCQDDRSARSTLATGDYIDLGANRIATVTGIGLVLEAGAATTSLYVAGITRGAPAHTATGMRITFGLLRN